jgi:hypothetical protein
MECLSQLRLSFFLLKTRMGRWNACVDWAVERLLLDQELGDSEVLLLAGARDEEEVLDLVPRIIERYGGAQALDDQFIAGKYVASLHADYLAQTETINSLDHKLSRLFIHLGYPDWLVMLARNCEYATDVDNFVEPFEREFKYVGDLWASAADRSDFEAKYDRAISDQHDIFPDGRRQVK